MARFRLAVVERLRAKALTDRADELHAVTATLQSMAVERDRLVAQLTETPGIGLITSGAELEQTAAYKDVLREQIYDAEERIAEHQVEVATAREAWMRARGDLRAVQALHERHRAAVRREQARREQRELDELAGRHGHVDTAAEHLADEDPAYRPLDLPIGAVGPGRPSPTNTPVNAPGPSVPAEIGPR
jgi:flagellar export protein FliJ